MTTAILWPTFALVALIFAVWLQVPLRRFGHIRAHPPTRADFASGEAAARYFAPVDLPADNLRNLFELPVLFFALVPLLLITRHAGTIELILAWTYVALRTAHTVIHTGSNRVAIRFRVHLASTAVLLAMWLGFAVDYAVAR